LTVGPHFTLQLRQLFSKRNICYVELGRLNASQNSYVLLLGGMGGVVPVFAQQKAGGDPISNDASFAKYEQIAENDAGFLAARRQMGTATRRAERRYFEIR